MFGVASSYCPKDDHPGQNFPAKVWLSKASSSLATALGTRIWKGEKLIFVRSEKLSLFAFGNKNRLTEIREKTRFSHFRVDQPFQDLKNKVTD